VIDNLDWESIRTEIKSSGFKRKGTSLGIAMIERQAKGNSDGNNESQKLDS
jgi:hypothetical protein